MQHGAWFNERDEDALIDVSCECGMWESYGYANGEDAAEAYGDHRAETARQELLDELQNVAEQARRLA